MRRPLQGGPLEVSLSLLTLMLTDPSSFLLDNVDDNQRSIHHVTKRSTPTEKIILKLFFSHERLPAAAASLPPPPFVGSPSGLKMSLFH